TQGTHIPPFLIASITSQCNLHCKGCYSRQNHATTDCQPENQLTTLEWSKVFSEAESLGISFILLAGGEPVMRKDVIREASAFQNIVFPIFTNGVFISKEDFQLFDDNRNLIPILSIEGDRDMTDERRGTGIFDRQMRNMQELQNRGLLFGASVTVTKKNQSLVFSEDFVRTLADAGCGILIYVEYVPVSQETEHIAPDDADREFMAESLLHLRESCPDMLFLSFPGDEKATGGCLAAGRGFFHINSHGDAEPCPFSPYSDTNIRTHSLLEVMQSGLFRKLHDSGVLLQEHSGGCVLFMHQEFVKETAGSL
ncbi:MAG: radical SAM protein, partial [Oscillospiraceae bacterium]|nr:radical SAM protein [Oscillospiraceae bacterium]